MFTLMMTWKQGRELMRRSLRDGADRPESFLERVRLNPPRACRHGRVPHGDPGRVPNALLHNLKHNKVLHERVVFLTVVGRLPRVPEEERVEVIPLSKGFVRVVARYGFMENPSIPDVLKRGCREKGLQFQLMGTSFFLGRETLIPRQGQGLRPGRGAAVHGARGRRPAGHRLLPHPAGPGGRGRHAGGDLRDRAMSFGSLENLGRTLAECRRLGRVADLRLEQGDHLGGRGGGGAATRRCLACGSSLRGYRVAATSALAPAPPRLRGAGLGAPAGGRRSGPAGRASACRRA